MFKAGDRVMYIGSHVDIKNEEGMVAYIRDETIAVDLYHITPRVYFHMSSVDGLLIKLNREPDWEI